mmetsp:Transcript_17081/g.35088  ORF Transcript_17081/g.35088 Transcript_17081/m.35088 type:complete len:129 (+) Transcript_17081:718-1104(+)
MRRFYGPRIPKRFGERGRQETTHRWFRYSRVQRCYARCQQNNLAESFADITVSQPNKKTDAASYPKAHPASHKTTDTTSHPPPDATSHSKANPASNKTTDKASDSQADTTSREQAHPFPDEPTYTEAR